MRREGGQIEGEGLCVSRVGRRPDGVVDEGLDGLFVDTRVDEFLAWRRWRQVLVFKVGEGDASHAFSEEFDGEVVDGKDAGEGTPFGCHVGDGETIFDGDGVDSAVELNGGV